MVSLSWSLQTDPMLTLHPARSVGSLCSSTGWPGRPQPYPQPQALYRATALLEEREGAPPPPLWTGHSEGGEGKSPSGHRALLSGGTQGLTGMAPTVISKPCSTGVRDGVP